MSVARTEQGCCGGTCVLYKALVTCLTNNSSPRCTLHELRKKDNNMADQNFEKVAAHFVVDTLSSGAIVEAKHASDEEHEQTLWQAMKSNRKACRWSILVSMPVVMPDRQFLGTLQHREEVRRLYRQGAWSRSSASLANWLGDGFHSWCHLR